MSLNSIVKLLVNQDQHVINDHLNETFNPKSCDLVHMAYKERVTLSSLANPDKQLSTDTSTFLLKKDKNGETILLKAIDKPKVLISLLTYRYENEFNPFSLILNETYQQGNTLFHLLIERWITQESLNKAIYFEIIQCLLEDFNGVINPFIKNDESQTIADYYINYLNQKPTPLDDQEHYLFKQFVEKYYLINTSTPLSFPLTGELAVFNLHPLFDINKELMPNASVIEEHNDCFKGALAIDVVRGLEKFLSVKKNNIVDFIVEGRALHLHQYFHGIAKHFKRDIQPYQPINSLQLKTTISYSALSNLVNKSLKDMRDLRGYLESAYEGDMVINGYYLKRRAALALSSGFTLAGLGFLIYIVEQMIVFLMTPKPPHRIQVGYYYDTCIDYLDHSTFPCEFPRYEDDARDPNYGLALVIGGVVASGLLILFIMALLASIEWYARPNRPDTFRILRQNPLISSEHNELINQLVSWFKLNDFYFNSETNPLLVAPVVTNQPITLTAAFEKLRAIEESLVTLKKLISAYEIDSHELFPELKKTHYPLGFFKQLNNPKKMEASVPEVSIELELPNPFSAIENGF